MKFTILELIKNINKDPSNALGLYEMEIHEIWNTIDGTGSYKDYWDFSDFTNSTEESAEQVNRFKAYWLGKHLCTDTDVGIWVYFLDDEPVIMASQAARKSPTEYKPFNAECAKDVLEYLKSFLSSSVIREDLEFQDVLEELPEGYYVHFADQTYRKMRLYNGKIFPVQKEIFCTELPPDMHCQCILENPNGVTFMVPIKETFVPWAVNMDLYKYTNTTEITIKK